MGAGITRRELLSRGVVGAIGLAAASSATSALLAACSSGAGTPAASAGPTARLYDAPPTTAPPETGGAPWWLRGGFAPVRQEVTITDLAVTGALPPELTGLYVRNGSNPVQDWSPHWFLGDGMVHGIQLENGTARWYRNRQVQTTLVAAGGGLGAGAAPGGAAGLSNVSVGHHGGRLLSLGEVGFPYELSPSDLSTIGPFDYDGALTGNMTAHPHLDRATGALHSFGYGFTPPFLEYRVADASGRLVHVEPIAVSRPTMMHDFAITDRDVIFWELPVMFDMQGAIKMVSEPHSGVVPFTWDPSYGARIGVMPLGGPASAIRWVDIDPCYVYHGVNAHRDGDDIVLDVCRLDSTFAPAGTPSSLTLHRWTVQTGGPQLRFCDERLDAPPADLPSIDRRHSATSQRHAWLAQVRDTPGTVDLGGVVHYDYGAGSVSVWDPGPGRGSGEWFFVPGGADEGEGWVMAFVYDAATDRSTFTVLDALDVAAGPIAEVPLPVRVPFGFHATWVDQA